MKIVKIARKENANCCDLASDVKDLLLKFRKNVEFAVVFPSYYGNRPAYTCTKQGAINAYNKIQRKAKLNASSYYGLKIVDSNGNIYICDGHNLIENLCAFDVNGKMVENF